MSTWTLAGVTAISLLAMGTAAIAAPNAPAATHSTRPVLIQACPPGSHWAAAGYARKGRYRSARSVADPVGPRGPGDNMSLVLNRQEFMAHSTPGAAYLGPEPGGRGFMPSR